MKTLPVDEENRLRQLAESLQCVLEQDLRLLADVEQETVEAWRKRGTGPSYIRFGRQFLYPVQELANHLRRRIRERGATTARI